MFKIELHELVLWIVGPEVMEKYELEVAICTLIALALFYYILHIIFETVDNFFTKRRQKKYEMEIEERHKRFEGMFGKGGFLFDNDLFINDIEQIDKNDLRFSNTPFLENLPNGRENG
jgi:hypothetical protein